MRFEAGHPVRVEFTKWGGRPHWSFTGLYLGEDEHGEWIGHPVGTEFARPGRGWIADWESVSLVPHHDAAHFPAFNRPNGKISSQIYVDMCTPPAWQDSTVTCIDLDLDVVKKFDGSVYIDDEDEFEHHQIEYGYPPEIISMTEDSAERVFLAVKESQAPYDTTPERWFEVLSGL
ncbi:MAG: DUF402 domain-containing protein [Actinomycetota bacterium]|jgi:uncharacterized protein|nr:DUF402 domain-containing protein [Actinomycetota bacterium]